MFSYLTGKKYSVLTNSDFVDQVGIHLNPLVRHLLHQHILIINDFMKVYEKLIIFIKSLIFNIF